MANFPTNEQDRVTKKILDSLNKKEREVVRSKFLPYEDDYLGHVSPLTDFLYYKKLPKVYRDFDEPLGKPLYRYLQSLIEGGYAELVSSQVEGENGVDNLLDLIDPQTCPDEFLPYYCKSMGIEWYPDLAIEGGEAYFVTGEGKAFYTKDNVPFGVIQKGRGTYFIRTFLSNVGEIYKRRGTESVVKYIAKVLTEMDVKLSYKRFIDEDGVTTARVMWVELQADTPEKIEAVGVNAKVIKRFVDTQIPYYITSVVTYVLKKNIECGYYLGSVVANHINTFVKPTMSHSVEGTVPISFSANGTPLLDYLISGNMEQDGTPTSDTPITPSECGELINEQYVLPVETFEEDILINNLTSQEYNGLTLTKNPDGSVRVQGTATANSNFHLYNDGHSAILAAYQIIENGIYYIGGGIEGGAENKFILTAAYDDATGGAAARRFRIPYGENIRIDNSAGEYKYLSVYIAVWRGATVDFVCKPYLKAVSSMNNIYLSEVETTRYIKKYIFDGTENWEIRQEGTNNVFFMLQSGDSAINHLIKATHFTQSNIGTINTATGVDVTTQGHIRFRPINASSMNISDFKAFLSQQYTTGTPVTVWYVLAEPITGIVNEPIRKIGDYADTVSYKQARVQIPTNMGINILNIQTAVKPSNIHIVYINDALI